VRADAGAEAGAPPPADPTTADVEAVPTDPIYLRAAGLPSGTDPAPSRVPASDQAARRRVGEEDDAFWREKLAVARGEASAGNDRAALELLVAALALSPPPAWESRLRSLRLEIKARHVDTDVLRVDARGDRDFVAFDTDVEIVLRLRNVGTDDVVIRAPEGEGTAATSGAALVLSVERRDVDVYAAQMRRSWTQVVPIVTDETGALRIPPESSHEIRARIPAGDAGGPIAGLHVLTVGGVLRAGRIETSLGEPIGTVPVRPARVLVLPDNYEPLAADPVGSLRKAVEAAAPVHLLVAAHFVPAERRAEAASILARALTDGPTSLGAAALNALRALREAAVGTPLRPLVEPMMDVLATRPARGADLMEGLVAVTGLAIAPDPRLWEEWWRRELAGGAAVSRDDRSPPARAAGAPPGPR
jgi:hypothetical protein